MTNQSKRYLVTYTDSNVSKETAVKTLGVSKTNVKDGVSMMAADKAPAQKDILHFENLGISVLELTQKDAKELATKKGVLVVEEDAKVYALDIDPIQPEDHEPQEVYVNEEEMSKIETETETDYELSFTDNKSLSKRSTKKSVEDKELDEEPPFSLDGTPLDEKNLSQDETDKPAEEDISTSESGNFSAGYKKALVDMFSSMLDANTKTRAAKSGSSGMTAQNADVSASSSNSYIPWNIKMVKAPEAWAKGYNGCGIKVAVLDTGINYNHPDLRVFGGANFADNNTTSYMDKHGHGTHCAGIIAAREYRQKIVGVAPRARLYAVKVLKDQGWGRMSWIIAGMEWCINHGIKVASMSLGAPTAPRTAYTNAVSRCQRNGVLVVTAAGNSYSATSPTPPFPFPWVCSPANSAKTNWWSPSPIAVGAVDINNNIAYFSSRGQNGLPWNPVGCVAPGFDIRSTYIFNEQYSGFRTMRGTSMACPHVSGLAALLWDRCPNASVYSIKKQLLLSTYYSHPYSPSDAKGLGLIHCERAVTRNYRHYSSSGFKKWYL